MAEDMTDPRPPQNVRSSTKALLLIPLIVLTAVIVFQLLRPSEGHAPIPPMFNPKVTLAEAEQAAANTGKVVLAYATANWCGPCQQFKRTTLVDPRVEAWVKEHAEPVYIDVDEHPDVSNQLGVTAIPAVYLIRDGKIASQRRGVISADEMLAWLGKAEESRP